MNDLGGKPCILLLLYCVYARKQLFHSLTTLLLHKFYLKKKTLHNCYDCYLDFQFQAEINKIRPYTLKNSFNKILKQFWK